MTAPTSDRARMIADLKDFIAPCSDGDGNADWHLASAIIRVCENLIAERMAQPSGKAGELKAPDTERLGGGERETVRCEQVHKSPYECIYFTAWSRVCDALRKIDEDWALHGAAIDKAPEMIRTLAQTAKDATARAEAAEAANMELDKERRSSDQSARDLRAENAQLRAQLDAMTGEQVPVIDVFCKNNVCMFGSSTFPSTLPDGVHTLYRHPSPAARVVGEMLVVQKGEMRTVSSTWNDEMLTTPPDVGTYALSITPNADGAK